MRNLEPVDLSFFSNAPKVVRSEGFIDAPRSKVFEHISGDPSGWGDWFPGFDHSGKYETPAPQGVGSVRTIRAFRTPYRETILAWEENERWAFRVDAMGSPMFKAFAEDYALTDKGSGTVLTWTVAFRGAPPMKLAAPFMSLTFRAVVRRVASGLTKVTAAS